MQTFAPYHVESNDCICPILGHNDRLLASIIPVLQLIGEKVTNQLQVAIVIIPSVVEVNEHNISKERLISTQVKGKERGGKE